MKKQLISLIFYLSLVSCAELQTIVNQVGVDANHPLTQEEVSSGLKEALRIGSQNAALLLSDVDGFYKDELVKIILPPQARGIYKNIKLLPGGRKLVDDVELRLNRAAEDAVKEATPIFATAIREMTIADAFGILAGDDTSATNYLREKTYPKLKQLFMPKVTASLDKKLVADLSTNESWNLLTRNYNSVAESFPGQLAGLKTITTQLDEYVTERALDGLFIKVADEEKKIRKDPIARVTNLLRRVFGKTSGN